jgi:hypothetical protein
MPFVDPPRQSTRMSDPLTQLQAAAARGDVRAQFQLGYQLARQGEMWRAVEWYQRAAGAGHPGAIRELGLLRLFGIGQPHDVGAGLALLGRAAAAGDSDGLYWLAQHALAAGDRDACRTAIDQLRSAAQSGHGLATRSLGLLAAAAGRSAEAAAAFALAVQQRDPHSATLLGALRETRLATGSTSVFPERSGAGGGIPPGEGEADPVPALPGALEAPDLALPAPVVHCQSPWIATCDDMFSALDCRHLIELGRPRLKPSAVVDPVSGAITRNTYRTSSSTELVPFQEDPWAVWLQRRLCRFHDLPLAHAEPLSLLHYAPGQQYKPHRDYLPPSTLQTPGGVRSGQRLYTAFVYLSDVEDGGATDFPLVGVRVAPKLGRAVLFHNVTDQGFPDDRTLHAGLPVVAGDKWLATLWLRERPIRHL